MKTETKYFGEIEYDEEDILRFPKGVYGFEEEREFLLLPFAGNSAMLCLQSLGTPQLAFVVLDPFALDADYAPVLQEEELKELDVSDSQDLYYYVMCVVKTPVAESTVNLKCPVAINGDSRRAMQVILESGDYHMRHRVAEFESEEGAEPC